MTTFVLVHGSWHGGWCYARVAEMLRADGHIVFTPTLTGLGERTHLASTYVNLSTHVQDIVALLDNEDLDDIVLCGHSYGGMVITGVANKVGARIRELVYLDAFIPADGQALWDLIDREWQDAFAASARNNGGFIAPIPASVFNVNAADRDMVDAKCVPQHAACFLEAVRAGEKLRSIRKKTYIFASGFPQTPYRSFFEEVSNSKDWEAFSIECGHDIMLDKPKDLVSLFTRHSD